MPNNDDTVEQSMPRLFHELKVHQIELELQNAELCRARDEVETALAQFTELYEFAPVGYFTLDPTGMIRSVNLCGASLLQVSRARLLTRRFGQLVAPAARPLFATFLTKVFERGGKESCELPMETDDGGQLVVQVEADALGKQQVCRLAVIDISARRKAEYLLHKYQELNRKTLQALPAHIAVLDRQGIILAVNHAWTEFAGSNEASSSPMVGAGADYVAVCSQAARAGDLDAARALSGIQGVLDGSRSHFTMEYPCHGHDAQRWFFMTVVPLDADGEGGAVITHLDVSERKAAEEKLKAAHDEMEAGVRERTAELSAANLQLTREIGERTKADASLKRAFEEIKHLKDRLQAENSYLQREVALHFNRDEVVGQSSAVQQVFARVAQVAPLQSTVLLLGETGTGKGMVARALYNASARKDRPLITVNCTTLPATLVESELFGREKGAFTGAYERQIGRFELANNGTIFLDEIGEMPLELQGKLLRVIQDGEFERLGSSHTIKTDVRIIAATNRDLDKEIREGRFREDLFYRLNVFPITIPPLRQRKEDIPLLVDYFLAKFNKKIGRAIETVSQGTLAQFQEYEWPGNVRELESVIERAVITSPGTELRLLDRLDTARKCAEPSGQQVKALIDLERDHILQVLLKTGWRVEGPNGAATLLGLNASTLRARIRKYEIVRS
jgi:formate hydrogenlyase transcriptional activator